MIIFHRFFAKAYANVQYGKQSSVVYLSLCFTHLTYIRLQIFNNYRKFFPKIPLDLA